MSTDLRQDIQQLRGLAILLVVAYHAGALLPSGFVGVDVFFVLSGFVITRSISRQVAD
ncbi:MAG: acyltransferase family protein, partial [Actinomycetota bacterium]